MRIKTLLTFIAVGSLLELGSARADAPVSEFEEHAASPVVSIPQVKRSGKKRRSRGAVLSGHLASAGELRDDPLDKPSGHLELYAVNFRESLEVELYDEDGALDDQAVDQLNHLWRCRRTGTEKAINPRLYEMLSRIYDRFQKRIELVSGFRNQERTSSFHFHGSASDIRIPGVSDKELHEFVRTLDTGGMGIGIYPRAGFIHVDLRPEPSYRWTDYSPPGSSDLGHRHKTKKSKKPAPNA